MRNRESLMLGVSCLPEKWAQRCVRAGTGHSQRYRRGGTGRVMTRRGHAALKKAAQPRSSSSPLPFPLPFLSPSHLLFLWASISGPIPYARSGPLTVAILSTVLILVIYI